ncbi:MAG: tRNA lysidine(34) synthetase TilS [Vicinamibacterales bacterium]
MAAVSGGSDSVALFCLLQELAASGDLTLAGLAHLHHHIRGEAADEDAQFCRALADHAGVPAFISDADVPAVAARDGQSIEVAGREERQRFFVAAREALGAARVALAHTRDDQAETVLLRLVRGAGPTGLAGISPRRDCRVRPLLEITRAELRADLEANGQTWRDDATNDDRDNPRNLIRHEILPRLRAINPRADAALARTADILRSDAEWFDRLANEAAARLVTPGDGRVRLDTAGLAVLPAALARRVALKALETANPGRSYGLEEAVSLCEAAAGPGICSLPGVQMERSGGAVVLVKRGRLESRASFHLRLPIPGEAHEPLGGWVLTARLEGKPYRLPAPQVDEVAVDGERLGTELVVRQRRPGDRLKPLGAPGHKKLQDVFVDRKVPRDERDRVPVVTDAAGQIVWVAGHVLAEGFRVTPLTTTVVVLTLRH